MIDWNNKEEGKEYFKRYYQQNKEKSNKQTKDWRINNQERYKERRRIYYQNNKERHIQKCKEWRSNNSKKCKEFHLKDYTKHKYHFYIRQQTYRKYGKLPVGWQYHHYTIPYHEDYWIGVHYTEHKQIDKTWKVIKNDAQA